MATPKTLADKVAAAGGLQHLLVAGLRLGPAVAVIDPDHDGVEGLPDMCRGRPVVLRWAFATELKADRTDNDNFSYVYGADRQRREARVPYKSLLAVIGATEGGQRARGIRRTDLPTWLSDSKGGAENLEAMLNALFEGRSTKQPGGGVQWRFQVPDDPSTIDPDRCQADKRAALRWLLDRDGANTVLMIDHTAAGARLDWPIAGPVTQCPLQRTAPFGDLQVTGIDVRWTLQPPGQMKRRFRVPWGALLAMQDVRDGSGWFWPADFPDAGFHAVFGKFPAYEALRPFRGVPFNYRMVKATADLNPVFLSPPPEVDKRVAIEACQALGGAVIIADRRADRVQLPGEWGEVPIIAVPLRLPGLKADAKITGLFVETNMPDHTGRIQRVRLPWRSIFAVATNEGGLHVQAWPDDYPAGIRKALDAAVELHETGEVAEREGLERPAEGEGLPDAGVALGRSEDGRIVLVLRQPVSPEIEPGKRHVLQMEFMLPRAEEPANQA